VILIVEDEIACGDTLRDALEDDGYDVAIARSGERALELLATMQPSLMILDLILPDMSGNALYDEIQRSPELAAVPVLITTSDPTRAPRGVPTVQKPLHLAEVLRLVALACGRG
jgi:DNA-binding response OmpR family regulator